MPLGIRDVAKAAGVSVGTVSNVLNGTGSVSPKTAKLVRATMAQIGFVPNSLARQLRTGSGTTVGLVVLDIANPFFAALAHECEAAAERELLTVLIGSSDQSVEREQRYIELFEEQRARGMIVAPVNGVTPAMDEIRRRGTPFILLDPISSGCCSVASDGRAAGLLAVRHLIETGRKDIAFVGGPTRQVEDRLLGATIACAETSGVRLRHIPTLGTGLADGRRVGHEIEAMAERDRPDAVFAANDLLAVGILQAVAGSSAISVPEDVALVGFDGIDYAETSVVPISTVEQPTAEIADAALRLLLEEVKDPNHEHRQLLLTPNLIVRGSTLPRSGT